MVISYSQKWFRSLTRPGDDNYERAEGVTYRGLTALAALSMAVSGCFLQAETPIPWTWWVTCACQSH